MFVFYVTIFSNVGNVSKVRSLIGEGINVSQQFDNGETPLHRAAAQGNEFLS